MFLITDMITGVARVSTEFASYDDAVTAMGGPARCNDFCSRHGCDIIWYDDDNDTVKLQVLADPFFNSDIFKEF